MFNGGNRKRSASGTTISGTTSKSSTTMNNNTVENDEQQTENSEEDKEENEKIEEKKREENDDKLVLPHPPPVKIAKTKARDKKLPIYNVVSSTTADEQLSDMNMFLSPAPPPPPSSTHYFPFPPPLPSSNSLSFVTFNSADWLQLFRSPLFAPSSFRLPLPTVPRRFPFEINNHNPSIIGSGSHSAFKPPIQKHE